jgi:hypothetical protein
VSQAFRFIESIRVFVDIEFSLEHVPLRALPFRSKLESISRKIRKDTTNQTAPKVAVFL